MYIESIQLINYKNFEEAELNLSPKLNCFIGNNGMGKTNLLDAIYHLSFCKSYFNTPDSRVVKHNCDLYMVQGHYSRKDRREVIQCGFKRGSKKSFKRNREQYKRLSDHIGLIPLVMISPADQNLILGGSEERRKFIDGVLSQFDRVYLNWLLQYNKVIMQRNKLLKQFAEGRYVDKEILSLYDDQLISLAVKIHKVRSKFIESFIPIFDRYYKYISGDSEVVSLIYKTDLDKEGFREQLEGAISKDLALGYTTVGTHKDDLKFMLGDYEIKKIGSQGQNKTYLIALKLAQFEFMRSLDGVPPILLLDDIFDKLDGERVEQIVKLVTESQFGQIFISDTNREHTEHIIPKVGADYKIFKIDSGVIEPI